MKKNKPLCLLALLMLASSCSSGIAADSSSEEEYPLSSVEAVLEKKTDYKTYMLSLKSSTVLPTYFFTFDEGVPYVSVNYFFTDFFKSVLDTPLYSLNGEGKLYNVNTKATMETSCLKNTVTFSDYDLFFSFYGLSIPGDIFSSSSDSLAKFNEEKSSFVSGGSFSFKLGKYSTHVISYEGENYIPFSFLETMVFSHVGTRIVFNGDAYYLFSTSYVYSGENLTSYGKAIYSGSLSKQTTRSSSYSQYFYNSFLFEMENFYGKFDELGISNLDEKLERAGLKEDLLSPNSKTADEAVARTINLYFGDGGHTAFYHRGLTVNYNYTQDVSLSQEILESDTRLRNLALRGNSLRALYQKSNAKSLDMSGETAVLRFTSFSLDGNGSSPTKESVGTDTTSTFGFLYNGFKAISANSSIKNVVLDVSLNGGGYAMALGHALSFLTDDSVTITVKNPLTGARYTECVDYDNDFDGDFKDKDSYSGKYNFYILTSGYSFSCGNAFPCIARENGYAKILGENSGGGDCSISASVGVDGTNWVMSSNAKLVHTNDQSSFDKGAGVDYQIDDALYYDVAKLNSYLTSLS